MIARPHRRLPLLPPTGRSAAAVGTRRVQPTTPVGSHRDSIAGVASEWPMTVSLSRMVTAGPERGCSGSADRRGSRGYRCSPVAARAHGWSARSGLLGAAGFLRASFWALGYGMVTAGDGDALRESRVGYGLHRRAAWSPGAASLDG